MRLLKIILPLVLLGLCCACSEKQTPSDPLPRITVVTATGGAGDNGYNDQILAGVMQVGEAEDISLSLITPSDRKEAQEALLQWCSKEETAPKELLVLASNEYEPLLEDIPAGLPSSRRILLIESEKTAPQKNVSSVFIRRYGVSFLSGSMAREAPAAYVMAAMPTDSYIGDAVKGFADGYRSEGKGAGVVYLADDESGYAMPEQAYKIMQEIEYNAFVYPLAGGSNSGAYKSAREQDFCLQLIAGMDVDCSQYSTRVPFSVRIDMKRITASLLEEWLDEGELREHYSYGMAEGDAVSVVLSPNFYRDIISWEEWYDDPDYWSDAYEKYKDMAIGKEEAYYEGR